MQLEEIAKKLDQIQETLNRIEERQKRTTAMVEDVKEKEGPVVGSFGTMDTGG
jgi:archaellum component FlaC